MTTRTRKADLVETVETVRVDALKDLASISADLLKAFPPQAIQTREGGGGKRLSYVSHDTVTRRLIEATGNVFDWVITRVDIRQDGLARGRNGAEPPAVMIVSGVLTIPGLGTREGTGVQVLNPGAGEDTYKMAESDALKRAAMRFGVAIDLYGDDIEGLVAQQQAQENGTMAAAGKTIPGDRNERQAAVVAEKERLGQHLTDYAKKTFRRAKLSDYSDDELEQLLTWSYDQK